MYWNILEVNLFFSMEMLEVEEDLIFQEDTNLKTTATTGEWFIQNNVKFIQWTSKSELNTKENL